MATITIPETLTGTAGLNRWDSPWLNPKFMTGLVMVVAVLLMGLIGGRFWNDKLALVERPIVTSRNRPSAGDRSKELPRTKLIRPAPPNSALSPWSRRAVFPAGSSPASSSPAGPC